MRGSRLKRRPFTRGWAYFCSDDGKFYIDTVVGGENKRVCVNPDGVPLTRMVNGKALLEDISLSASDVGALPTTGGTLTGDLTGKYMTATWFKTTSATDLGHAPAAIPVLDSSGWFYKRTPAELLEDIGGKSSEVKVTLSKSGWADGQQTVAVAGVTAERNGVIGLDPAATDDQVSAAESAKLRLVSYADGSITIAAKGAVPTTQDIPISVILAGSSAAP